MVAENFRRIWIFLISRQALFGPFAAWEKGLAATRQCVLRKKALIGGETKTVGFRPHKKRAAKTSDPSSNIQAFKSNPNHKNS